MHSDDDLAARLRAICMALPEVTERASHGVPTWFVRDKKSFAQLWADGHHGDNFPHLWCAGLPGAQEALIGSAPDRFFRPPYVGHRGWIGARLDGTSTGPSSPNCARTPTVRSPPPSSPRFSTPADTGTARRTASPGSARGDGHTEVSYWEAWMVYSSAY